MKNKIKCKYIRLFLVAFIFLSILAVLPDGNKDYIADFTLTELNLEEKTDNKSTTYTYVNTSGKTTFAIDKGYAVRVLLKNAEGQIILHQFLGNKIYSGWSAVKSKTSK